jgi:hypothetical protein
MVSSDKPATSAPPACLVSPLSRWPIRGHNEYTSANIRRLSTTDMPRWHRARRARHRSRSCFSSPGYGSAEDRRFFGRHEFSGGRRLRPRASGRRQYRPECRRTVRFHSHGALHALLRRCRPRSLCPYRCSPRCGRGRSSEHTRIQRSRIAAATSGRPRVRPRRRTATSC